MTLLATFEHGDYRAEFGAVMVCGTWAAGVGGAAGLSHLDLVLLADPAFAGRPKGDIAGAGAGWLLGTSAAHAHVVLEVHDEPPPAPGFGGWCDVMETPFLTSRAEIRLSPMGGGDAPPGVPLPRPGLHRVRVSRRRTSAGHRWLLQFWPVTGVPEPPRFLARARPVVGGDRPGNGDRRYAALAMDVLAVTLWAPGRHTFAGLARRLLATPEQVREALRYLTRRGLLRVERIGGQGWDSPTSPLALTPVRPREARISRETRISAPRGLVAAGRGPAMR